MNATFVVLLKEFREMAKDKRVIRTVFLTPLLSMFLMTQLIGVIIGSVDSQKNNSEIALLNHGGPNSLLDDVKKSGANIKFVDTVEAGKDLIQKGTVKLMLEIPADFGEKAKQNRATITAYFDGAQESSKIALSGVEEAVRRQNTQIAKATLKANNLPEETLEPLKLEKKDVAKKKSADFLMQLMPYMMILLSFVAGMAFAADLVAGEKERLTLETLLLTPAQRTRIVFGKYLALASICIASACMTFLSINIFGHVGKAAQLVFPDGTGFDLVSILSIIAVMVPLAFFFAGILLAASSYAKNMRECQGYLGFVSSFITIPAVLSQVIGITNMTHSTWIKFVPILNTSLVIRQGFQGQVDPLTLVGAVATSAVLALVGYLFAVRMFRSEKVLNRI